MRETGSNPTKEVELKLKLSPEVYEQLSLLLPMHQQATLQENSFFDTEEQILIRHRWGLRVRKTESHRQKAAYHLTAKGPVDPDKFATGVHVRPEYEVKISEDEARACYQGFRLSALRKEPCLALLEQFGDLYVTRLFFFTNHRQFFKFQDWVIELDKTEMKDHIFFELEIETSLQSMPACQAKLHTLFMEHGWTYEPSTENKLEKAVRYFLKKV
jgi:uncharacterized protein YjbK